VVKATLLCGWLLMYPPLDAELNPRREASWSEWHQQSGHDTAAACERERAAWQREVQEMPVPDSDGPKSAIDLFNLKVRAAVYARCVPVDVVWPHKGTK